MHSKIIKQLITEFNQSSTKRKMLEGERYSRGQNDILKRPLNQYKVYDPKTNNVITKTNDNKSDEHIPHCFYPKQVNQKKAYVCGKPITISYNAPVDGEKKNDATKSAEKKITNMVWNTLGPGFEKIIKNRLKEASNKGRAWLHPNYKDGKLVFEKIPSEECIPVYDTETQTYLTNFLHFYIIQDLNGEKPEDRIYVEVWDEKEVKYYIETKVNNEVVFLEDTTRSTGCHWFREIYDEALDNLKSIERHSWGKVPFIEIENNEEKTTDLEPIKPLIDAYDLINSGFVNTIEDLKEIVWLINGYGAEDLLQLIENLKINGVARTNDTNGHIDAKLLPIPYEARQALLKGLKELIYEFGRAVDTSNKDLIGKAPSGVSLEFLYTDLDMKADDAIGGLTTALYEVLWYVIQDLKMKGKLKDTAEINEFDFKIEFNKSRIFNEVEKVNTINNDTTLSLRRKLEIHPYVDDVETELKRIQEEKAENMKLQSQIFNTSGEFNNHDDDDDTNE